ncbi:MAG: DUF393 domain-containing protein [Pseudomonadota bacterium]
MTDSTSDSSVVTAGADDRAAATVFYDGGCPVCSREIATYRGMRGADEMEWVDVSDPESEARLPEGMDRDQLMARFTVRRRDGALSDGAAGFAALWRGLDRMGWAGRLLDRTPFVQIAEMGYRGFLALRPLWRRS